MENPSLAPVLTDLAEPILRGDQTLDDDTRASLWDAFHSKSPEELAQHLQPLAVPDDTKRKLFAAKQASVPPPAPLDKVTEAVKRIAALDPQVREIAETSPNLLKAFTTAATAPKKTAPGAPGATQSKGKGKVSSPAPALTPDFPATPSGHALVHASDGNLYHIPVDKAEQARTLDPNLKILHVEPDQEA